MQNKKPLTTTLERIRNHQPCKDGWEKLLKGLGKSQADDEPLPYSKIVEINGIEDAVWCCRAEPKYDREWRLFAVWCARQIQHLMPDQHSIEAINLAERFANSEATKEELDTARNAIIDAPDVTSWTTILWDITWTIASDVLKSEAWYAAATTAYSAAEAAYSATEAAGSVENIGYDVAREKQKQKFLQVVG